VRASVQSRSCIQDQRYQILFKAHQHSLLLSPMIHKAAHLPYWPSPSYPKSESNCKYCSWPFCHVLDLLVSNSPPLASPQFGDTPALVLQCPAAEPQTTHVSCQEVTGRTRKTLGGVPTRISKVDHVPSTPSLWSWCQQDLRLGDFVSAEAGLTNPR
jgi:hypothetical protein